MLLISLSTNRITNVHLRLAAHSPLAILAMSRSPSLLESQTKALLTLINLNEPPSQVHDPLTNPTNAGQPSRSAAGSPAPNAEKMEPLLPFEKQRQGPLVWKVLILDEQSKDVLATSLRVQDLREQGVTLHM